MTTLNDDPVRAALRGDVDAVEAHLLERGIEPELASVVVGWYSSRANFNNLVAARKHYLKRRWHHVSKPDCVKELIDKFGLSSHVAQHIADGKGYASVRAEAIRQLKAEADEGSH